MVFLKMFNVLLLTMVFGIWFQCSITLLVKKDCPNLVLM